MDRRPATLDPLYARTPADQLAARQLHEPLVEELGGPFDLVRRIPGLALSVQPSADRMVWRVLLPAPDPGFDSRLADPRLGIVSPRAIDEAAGGPLDPSRLPESGTGPFELRERGADRVLLARNTSWWGTDHGLGPAVDQVEVRAVPEPGERLALLRDGTVRVADLRPAQLPAVRGDPLLTVVPQGDGVLGVERSVRGIPPGEPVPSLNAVWLTGIDAG